MVIYNGSHYDALAISPSPKAPQDDDVTGELQWRVRATAVAATLCAASGAAGPQLHLPPSPLILDTHCHTHAHNTRTHRIQPAHTQGQADPGGSTPAGARLICAWMGFGGRVMAGVRGGA
jgi:hypothetical protein